MLGAVHDFVSHYLYRISVYLLFIALCLISVFFLQLTQVFFRKLKDKSHSAPKKPIIFEKRHKNMNFYL